MKCGCVISYVAALMLCLFLAGSCREKPRIIPRDTLTDIYCEMLLTDVWILENAEYRKMADTTLVYEPIFNKYGYTFEDYDATLNQYLTDPEILEKIFKEIGARCDKKIAELQAKADLEDQIGEFVSRFPKFEKIVFSLDTLGRDSLSWWRRFRNDTVKLVLK